MYDFNFSDMFEDTLDIFLDDYLVVRDSLDECMINLNNIFQYCEEFNLVLNWDKYHFMVKEGIMLGHKISTKGSKWTYPK